MRNQGKEMYEFGPFRLDPGKRVLLRDNQPVPLQLKAFETLLVLVRNSEQVVLKDDLMKSVWPDTFVEESNLAQHIFVLRKILGESAREYRYIITIPGRGYRFAVKVRVVSEEESLVVEAHSRSRMVIEEKHWLNGVWRPVGAMAIAMALVGGVLYWRSHRAPKLTERDSIVIADFANTTGDTVFDGTLRQGLSAQLDQSPFLNLLSDQRVAQTLSLMAQPKDARLTHELAREVCERTGSVAVLDGSIAQVGTQYLLLLKASSCANGESLANAEAQAKDKNHVLGALGKLALEIRSKLGESLASLQKYDVPPEEVTTPSLEALRLYSLGLLARKGDLPPALKWFQRAVDLDHNFAMAYAQLGMVYFDLGESVLATENLRKAYDLRERVSELERFHIESNYEMVVGNLEAARKDCELWAQIYPRDPGAPSTLAIIYLYMGQWEKVLIMTQRMIELRHQTKPESNLVAAFTFLNQLDKARTLAQEGNRIWDSPLFNANLYMIDFLQGDRNGMDREAAKLMGKPGWEDRMLDLESNTAAYGGEFAKSRELTRRAVDSAQRAGETQTAAAYEAEAATREALVGNQGQAKQLAKSALALSNGWEVEGISAIALALAGDSAQGSRLADELDKRYPENTIVHLNFLPTIRAALALGNGDPGKALGDLAPTMPYELGYADLSIGFGLYPVYLRGEAYLASNQGSTAGGEFQKIILHSGVVQNELIGALAHLQLGRAYAMAGDTAKGQSTYQDFLRIWKDADPAIPILKQAKAEYAKLH